MTKEQATRVLDVLRKENIPAALDDDSGDAAEFSIEVSGIVTADANDIVERLREDIVEGDPVAIERICAEVLAASGDGASPGN